MRKTKKYCDHTGREGAITLTLSTGIDSEGIDTFEELDIHPSELKRRVNAFCNGDWTRVRAIPNHGKMLWEYLCENRKTQAVSKDDDQ